MRWKKNHAGDEIRLRQHSCLASVMSQLQLFFSVFLFFHSPKKVYTFVGPPEAVVEAALAAAFKAYDLIDMSRHKGKRAALR